MSRRRSVLLLCGAIEPSGGGAGVAAWMLEALRRDHDVTLLAHRAPRFGAVDEFFGTRLAEGNITVEVIPALRLRGVQLALIRQHQLFRAARGRHHRFEVVISNENEADIGRRCIQYVHHPWGYLPRPEIEMRWYHRLPGTLALYRRAAIALSAFRPERMAENLTLANSAWTAGRLREWYAMSDVTVLPPPVVGAGTPPPWEERRSGFVMLGRMAREKRVELAVEVLRRVREAGHAVTLEIAGTADDLAYERQVQRRIADEPWAKRHVAIPRRELASVLLRNRYGIHCMVDEHFGMAVAEMLRAGCIPFAHDSGGPPEILADSRLLYHDADDAVAKILAVLRSHELQADLCRHVSTRADRYSEERFMTTVRELVASWSD